MLACAVCWCLRDPQGVIPLRCVLGTEATTPVRMDSRALPDYTLWAVWSALVVALPWGH